MSVDGNPGSYGRRLLSDGRELEVVPLTYGRARLVVNSWPGSPTYDDAW